MSPPTEYRQNKFTPLPGAADILLVRHGESAPAREGETFPLVDGHGDPPLDPVGEAQALRVADRLAGDHIAAIYVSTLQRTGQTAAPLAARLGIEPVVEPDLREVFLGDWEGGALFRKYVTERHPLAREMLAQQRWDVIPGAESNEAVIERAGKAISRIAERHPDQRVAVFSHGGVIGQLLAHATGAGSFSFTGSDNASISQIVVLGDNWVVRRFNDTAHLHPGFSLASEPLI